jgi:tripartite-type tricarboxylate transporter receptor subunit TctC
MTARIDDRTRDAGPHKVAVLIDAVPARLLMALAFAFPFTSAGAADYPTRPIRMIVPFVAGGGTDLLARFVSPRLSELLGQQVVVDNRGGAGSVLGTQILAKSAPDGYTLAVMDTAFAINPALADKLPYDAERDFVFVAIIATSPSLLVAHPGLKVRTVQELLALAKRQPGKITFGSAGVGSSSHLTAQMLMTAAKIELLHIPYKGAGAAILEVLGGHTDLTSVVPGSVTQHIKSGTLVPLVITGKNPYHLLPNVPTYAGAGLPTVDPGAFRFLAAPAGLPAAIQKKLGATMRTVLEPQEFRARLIDNGFDPELLLEADARAYIAQEIRKWRQAVKDAGAK